METMKSASMLAFAFVLFGYVSAELTLDDIKLGLTQVFTITPKEVEKCLSKTGAIPRDFVSFDSYLTDSAEDVDENSIRRSTCTMACCAQAQGTMSGPQIQLPFIHKLIQESDVPGQVQNLLHNIVNACYNQVKDIKDECKSGFHFLKCVAMKYRNSERI